MTSYILESEKVVNIEHKYVRKANLGTRLDAGCAKTNSQQRDQGYGRRSGPISTVDRLPRRQFALICKGGALYGGTRRALWGVIDIGLI